MTEETFKAIREILDKLGFGLNQLLRWSFLGFFAVTLLFALGFDERIGEKIKVLTPVYALIVVFIISVGLYAVHRSLVIWLHHLFGTLIFRILDQGNSPRNSMSPTRWLGGAHKVKVRYRIVTYQLLRKQKEVFKDKKKRDVAHAVNGLIVMFFEGFLVAGLLVWQSSEKMPKAALILFILAFLSLIASYPMAWFQHTEECLLMKKAGNYVGTFIKDHGVPVRDRDDNPKSEAGSADGTSNKAT